MNGIRCGRIILLSLSMILIGMCTMGDVFGQGIQPPVDQRPVNRDITRGKFWLLDAVENNVGVDKAGTYPGYHDTRNHVLHNQTAFFLDVTVADQSYHEWPRAPYMPNWCTQPQQLVKNYNFKLSIDEAEEYTEGRCHTYDSDPSDEFIPLLYELYTKRMVWSLPKYDDFVIWKMVVKNIDTRPWTDAYIGYNYVVNPSGAGDARFTNDNEYVWASDLKTYGDEQGAFIFYDDVSWPNFSNAPAIYLYPPGDETGDRGDPGNILEANSVDRRLYSPQAVAVGFLDAKPNRDGQKKFRYNIRNSEGIQPWSHQNAPSTEKVDWNMTHAQSIEIMLDEAPRISWKQANAENHQTAGSTWERTPLLTTSIGPYDIAPGDSVEFLFLFVGGELDRDIAMRGGIEATRLLPEAAIEDVKTNWASAIEIIENDYKPIAYPPPTPGNVPRENHGDELEVETFAELNSDGLPVEGYIVKWLSIPETYRDPLTNVNDFAGYRVYRSVVGVEGPWEQIVDISKEEAESMVQGDRVAFRWESDPGIPSRFAVTSYDTEGLESGRTAYSLDPIAAPRAPIDDLSKVLVVPNPFRQVSGLLDAGEEKRLEFVNIPSKCTIRIYTMVGELLTSVEHDGFGSESWGSSTGDNNNYMLTQWATNVSPGIYLYHITSNVPGHEGETTTGKFAILK